jgi:hypothetical protein
MKNTYILASEQHYDSRNRLKKLISHEVDSIRLLRLCIETVKTVNIRNKLRQMENECENNRRDLVTLMNMYGTDVQEKPPVEQPDSKGFFMDGSAILKGGLTEKGALKILHDNMKNITDAYEKSLKTIQSNEEKETIQRIIKGKKKFLNYLEICLSQCVVKENIYVQ